VSSPAAETAVLRDHEGAQDEQRAGDLDELDEHVDLPMRRLGSRVRRVSSGS
jgi:hypothetical protein